MNDDYKYRDILLRWQIPTNRGTILDFILHVREKEREEVEERFYFDGSDNETKGLCLRCDEEIRSISEVRHGK